MRKLQAKRLSRGGSGRGIGYPPPRTRKFCIWSNFALDIPEPTVTHCPEYKFLTVSFLFVFFLVFPSFPVLYVSYLNYFLSTPFTLFSLFSSYFQSFFPFFILCRSAVPFPLPFFLLPVFLHFLYFLIL